MGKGKWMNGEDPWKKKMVKFETGGYVFTQAVLFVIHYGFHKVLPWWVLWFPSIIIGISLVILLLAVIVGIISGLLRKRG